MIKSRPFLFGLGSGLIAGALLLQLMISGGAAPLTKEQIIQGAERLNLTVTDETVDPSSNEAETDIADEEAEKANGVEGEGVEVVTPSEPSVVSSPSPVASPEAPVNTNKTSLPKKPSEPSASTSEKVEKPEVSIAPSVVAPEVQEVTQNSRVSVYIPNGSTLTETANLLADAGAIKDKSLFLKIANDRKINTIIQYGTYSFDADENIDSIIDKLITLK